MNSLLGVLLRFRTGGEIAFQADVNAMFNQIFITRQHWNLMRFLWFKDDDLDAEPEGYQILHNFFGGTHAPALAGYAVKKTCIDNRDDFHPETIKTGLRNSYVDDILKSLGPELAVIVVSEIFKLYGKTGFELAKFVTTDRSLLELVKPELQAPSMKESSDLEMGYEHEERVLGVKWNVTDDTFGFKTREKERPLTRRGLLGNIAAMFDPEGSVAPVTLIPRQILQDITAKGYGWDEPLPELEATQVQEWLQSIQKLADFKRERAVVPKGFGKIVSRELHAFSDGSETGLGFEIFIKSTNEEGACHISFLLAKALVTPTKVKTIPRIELQAMLLSMRGVKFVIKESDCSFLRIYQWTDSSAVLMMVQNSKRRFLPFVANRLQEIRDLKEDLKIEIRHVPGEMNPADVCSRGLTVENFLRHELFHHGPSFLQNTEEDWPSMPKIGSLPDDHPEGKKDVTVTVLATEVKEDPLMKLVHHHSSWAKLRVAVAWLIRFIIWNKDTRLGRNAVNYTRLKGRIKGSEIQDAGEAIVRYVQRQEFSSEIKKLGNVGPKMKHSQFQKLCPFIDPKGSLRVGGRLSESSLPYNRKHQLLLPNSHHLTMIIARYYHESYMHAPPKTLLYMIRKHYWIIHGTRLSYKIQETCKTCIRTVALPKEQVQGTLPVSRVAVGSAWLHTGCDIMGPVLSKMGRSTPKRYILGLVSFTIKAVHFEVLPDMTVPAFLNALRRFIARRSRPQELSTDCAGTFAAGIKELNELQDVYNNLAVEDFLRQKEICWVPNIPKASNRNGLFERPFRSLRRALLGTLKDRTPTEDQLMTIVAECEFLYNSRPLCAQSNSPDDIQPLTPNDLLNPEPAAAYAPGVFVDRDLMVRNHFRQVQAMVDIFWHRFRLEYLTSLQERTKQLKETRNFQVGDVVLLVEDMKLGHRGHYPMGRITAVNPSTADNNVRTVQLKTSKGTYARPVKSIVLLEAEGTD
ncbi:uncharacterized protein LOC135484828 [Lineus longissimus]|uniref:uncharacterized protein LOC135484828 n=1 Tax=Lineus longissimus TaxID=88925 RepID=UPI00315DA561